MPWTIFALVLILGAALLLPLSVKRVEEELEAFLLALGALAVSASGGWSMELVGHALREPIGIALAVLGFGALFKAGRGKLRRGVGRASALIGLPAFLFLLVLVLGLASGVITAVVAALVLVETLSGLTLPRAAEIRVTILACFAIGLGAALTPVGEPLSAIATAKLAGEPHHAGFSFLANLLAIWILPAVVLLAALAAREGRAAKLGSGPGLTQDRPERVRDVFIRGVKVYAFTAGLVLLAEGLSPLVDRYVLGLPRERLFWLNTASAALDNATLAAAELSPAMPREDLRFALMGLLLAGGMLIPGNIPNIVAANKLGIKSTEWAKFALPLGAVLMGVYFLLLRALS